MAEGECNAKRELEPRFLNLNYMKKRHSRQEEINFCND
jgi:hypothetical protein